jgi:hypothetical protein
MGWLWFESNLYYYESSYWVFRAWGRIGTTIGGTKVDEDLSKHEAIELFRSKYAEQTGNEWGATFVKRPGFYTRMEIDYGEVRNFEFLDLGKPRNQELIN